MIKRTGSYRISQQPARHKNQAEGVGSRQQTPPTQFIRVCTWQTVDERQRNRAAMPLNSLCLLNRGIFKPNRSWRSCLVRHCKQHPSTTHRLASKATGCASVCSPHPAGGRSDPALRNNQRNDLAALLRGSERSKPRLCLRACSLIL